MQVQFLAASRFDTAQRKLDYHTWSLGSAPKGNIGTTHYGHSGPHWDFSSVKQSLPITSASILKYLHVLCTIKHTKHEGMETRSQCYC